MASILTIGKVARLTGLTPGCIRAWESRYGAVTPNRTSSGRRSYSDDNVSRLKLLAEITGYGYSIGALAGLTDEELQQELQVARLRDPNRQDITVVDQLMENILEMDIGECDSRLAAAFVNLRPWPLAELVIAPLLDAIDEKSENQVHVGQRHLIVNMLRRRLFACFQVLQEFKRNPVICFTTLDGEEHEIDALLSCYLAMASGIYSQYIGPNVSEAELVEIVGYFNCEIVSVSVRTPLDESDAVSRLIEVRKELPDNVHLWIGGSRASEAGSSMEDGSDSEPKNFTVIENFTRLREELDKLALHRGL